VASLMMSALIVGGFSTQAGAAPSGTPIKIGLIAPTHAVIDYSDLIAAEDAAVLRVNAAGGINGHPVTIDYCNDQLMPVQTANCARQMVTDQVIGTAGDFSAAGEPTVLQTLAAAGIPSIGNYDFGAAGSDAHTYMIQPSMAFMVGAQAYFGAKQGKAVADVMLDVPSNAPYPPEVKKIIQASGGNQTAYVPFQQTDVDLSSQAAEAKNAGTKSAILSGADASVLSLMQNLKQLGYTGTFDEATAAISEQTVKSIGSSVSQLFAVSPFPALTDTGNAGIAQFISDMNKEASKGNAAAKLTGGYYRSSTMGGYLAVLALAKVANQAHATTSAHLNAALKTAKNVQVDGLLTSWTPSKSISTVYPRNTYATYYMWKWKNGKPYDSGPTLNAAPLVAKAS
jgi:ABC-type branched-subunit amino acid transport system substrate-binding protein